MSAQPPTIYFIRHGETDWNSGSGTEEKFRGHKDVPLNDTGRQEAKDAAKALCPLNIVAIYSSDLSRASDTAKIIGKECGVKPVTAEELRPWDLGKLTGTPVKEGLAQIREYATKKPSVKLPGGESFYEFSEPVLTYLDGLLEKAKKLKGAMLIVTHTRDLQLTKASAGAPGGFNNHDTISQIFDDYTAQVHTGDVLKVQFDGKDWKIVAQGAPAEVSKQTKTKVVAKGKSLLDRTQV